MLEHAETGLVGQFRSLEKLSRRIARSPLHTDRSLTLKAFETFSDHLAIARLGKRFGDNRFVFFGAALAEAAPNGDLSGFTFGEILDDPFYRASLKPYRHVQFTGLPHVTRNHPLPGIGYFTRLLIPVFAGNTPDMILSTAFTHAEPLSRDAMLTDGPETRRA